MSLPTKEGELTGLPVLSIILGWVLAVTAAGHTVSKVAALLPVAVEAASRGSVAGLIVLVIPLGLLASLFIQWRLTVAGSWVFVLLNGSLVFAAMLASIVAQL